MCMRFSHLFLLIFLLALSPAQTVLAQKSPGKAKVEQPESEADESDNDNNNNGEFFSEVGPWPIVSMTRPDNVDSKNDPQKAMQERLTFVLNYIDAFKKEYIKMAHLPHDLTIFDGVREYYTESTRTANQSGKSDPQRLISRLVHRLHQAADNFEQRGFYTVTMSVQKLFDDTQEKFRLVEEQKKQLIETKSLSQSKSPQQQLDEYKEQLGKLRAKIKRTETYTIAFMAAIGVLALCIGYLIFSPFLR